MLHRWSRPILPVAGGRLGRRLPAALLLALSFWVQRPAPVFAAERLAWSSQGWLWTARVNRSGRPRPGTRQQRVAQLWQVDASEHVALACSPNGNRIAVEHFVDTEGVPRYGLSRRGDYCGIWLVSPKPGAVLRKIGRGYGPRFSPDGTKLAFTSVPDGNAWGRADSDVVIVDVASGRRRILCRHAYDASWSADGKEIAAIVSPPRDPNRSAGVVLDVVTGKVKFRSWNQINPQSPLLSPDGRYLAVHFSLSRPLTGHTLLDRRTGRAANRGYTPGRYAPGLLYDWTRDGKWLLWSWRIVNPENEGTWTQEYVGITDRTGRFHRRIGRGKDAAFSPDGKNLLWLRPASSKDDPLAEPRNGARYALTWAPRTGRRRITLLKQVDAFAVSGSRSPR